MLRLKLKVGKSERGVWAAKTLSCEVDGAQMIAHSWDLKAIEVIEQGLHLKLVAAACHHRQDRRSTKDNRRQEPSSPSFAIIRH